MSTAVLLPAGLLALGGVLVAVSGQQELRRRWCSWVGAAVVLLLATHLSHGMVVLALVLAAVAGAELARLLATSSGERLACWTVAVGSASLGLVLPMGPLALTVCLAALTFRHLVDRKGTVARLALPAGLVGLPLAALATLPTSWTVPALLAVSVGDVAAWVGGRTLGRRGRLARGLSRWSPNKTWAGAVACVLAGGLVLVFLGQWWLAVVVPAAGILGDLRESQVKRLAGVKDAGTWLPGFGGMLDRIDSILGALVGICLAVLAMHQPLLAGVGLLLAVPGPVLRRLLWRAALAGSGGLTVRGSLPVDGCVVVAPHVSHADSAVLLAALDAGHAPRFAAAADYWFRTPLRAAACRGLVGGFSVRRSGGGMVDLLAEGEHLRRGGAVVVYPEGSRSSADGAWHAGAFRLAAELGVPVVPVAVLGTDRLLPKSGRLSRHRVDVVVGEPMSADDSAKAQAWVADQRASAPRPVAAIRSWMPA